MLGGHSVDVAAKIIVVTSKQQQQSFPSDLCVETSEGIRAQSTGDPVHETGQLSNNN